MPRSAAGVYTLPAGNPVVTNTLITSTWANDTMPDLGSEITNSLDRSGRGGMLAPLKGVDGAVGAPLYSFTNEPTTGLYRSAAGVLSVAILGVLVGSFTSTGWADATGKYVLKAGDSMTGALSTSASSNAVYGYSATNSSAGTGAAAGISLVNNGALAGTIGITGTAYTALAFFGASAAFLYGNGVGGVAINAANAAGTIRFAAGGSTEQARLTAAGEFLVGGNGTSVYTAANRGVLEINGATNAIVALKAANAGIGYMFHDGTNMFLTALTGNLNFQVAGTTKASIASATGLFTASSGANFGNAAIATTTTLDWYEEGTFTPALTGIGAPTLTVATGEYQRIGNKVKFRCTVNWTGGTNAAAITGVTGLPYASTAAVHPLTLAVNLGTSSLTFVGTPMAYLNGSATITLVAMSSGASALTLVNPNAGTKDIYIAGEYFV